MSTHAHTQNKRTDPRAKYIFVGIDKAGGHHIYRTSDETVMVIEGTTIAYKHDLDGRSINEWLDYVEGKRGWGSQLLYKTFADFAGDRL